VLDTGAWSFIHNAVFPPADLPRLACALQDAVAAGGGGVVTLEHVTVPNSWWGIAGGRRVSVTWVYLSAAPQWAALLPAETAARLAPAGGDDLLGPAFPHYGTLELALAPRQVNLLHSLCDWTVRRHAQQFALAMLPRPGDGAPPESDGGGGAAAEPSPALFTRSARLLLRGGSSAGKRVLDASSMAARVVAQLLLSLMPRHRAAGADALGQTQQEEPRAAQQQRDAPPAPAPPVPSTAARRALETALSTIRGVLPSG
jgi:hypothetical protein